MPWSPPIAVSANAEPDDVAVGAGKALVATPDGVGPIAMLVGTEFVEPPEQRPYGIDSGLRDPSGNHIRLTQVMELALQQ